MRFSSFLCDRFLIISAQLPSQSAPTILKNRAPCFLKNGAPCFLQKAGWKKQGHSLFKKRRDQAASSLFELQWPWFFALCFFQKAGCPIFKNSGCRLTGRLLHFALAFYNFFIFCIWQQSSSRILQEEFWSEKQTKMPFLYFCLLVGRLLLQFFSKCILCLAHRLINNLLFSQIFCGIPQRHTFKGGRPKRRL